jgi:hypothetical protein
VLSPLFPSYSSLGKIGLRGLLYSQAAILPKPTGAPWRCQPSGKTLTCNLASGKDTPGSMTTVTGLVFGLILLFAPECGLVALARWRLRWMKDSKCTGYRGALQGVHMGSLLGTNVRPSPVSVCCAATMVGRAPPRAAGGSCWLAAKNALKILLRILAVCPMCIAAGILLQ